MKIFVTGATGFIGQNLVSRLLREGHHITVLLRDQAQAESFLKRGCSVVTGDILNTASLAAGVAGCDRVYHLAAFTKPVPQDPDEPFRINVTGSMNVIEAAGAAGAERIIIVSTAGTLGYSAESRLLDESAFFSGTYSTEYERTKAIAETQALKHNSEKTSIIIVNPTRVFGPGKLTAANSVTKIIRLYGRGLWRILPGDGTAIGNYVFIDDVVSGLILAGDRGRGGERYILGGENISFSELFNTIGDAFGRRRNLVRLNKATLKAGVRLAGVYASLAGSQPRLTEDWINKYLRNYIISSSKAINELGYEITPFRTSVEKTVAWLRSGNR